MQESSGNLTQGRGPASAGSAGLAALRKKWQDEYENMDGFIRRASEKGYDDAEYRRARLLIHDFLRDLSTLEQGS